MSDKASQDNRSAQMNPTSTEYGGKHADSHNPTSSSCSSSGKSCGGDKSCCGLSKTDAQRGMDARANASNPNYKKWLLISVQNDLHYATIPRLFRTAEFNSPLSVTVEFKLQ